MRNFLVGLVIGLLLANYNAVLGVFANPTLSLLAIKHRPLNNSGHWHFEVDANTGFIYAAPGYCGTEVNCD